jgi:diguanylate cyclase
MNKHKDFNPSTIARDTLLQLASLKLPPTPDNFHKLYNQIAGDSSNGMSPSTKKMLSELAAEFPRHTPLLLNFANSLEKATHDNNWDKYKHTIMKVIEVAAISANNPESHDTKSSESEIDWASTIETLLKQLESKHDTLTTARKRAGLSRVLGKFTHNSRQLHLKLQALISSWTVLTSTPSDAMETETKLGAQIVADTSLITSQEIHSEQDASSVRALLPQANTKNNFTNQLLKLLAMVLDHMAKMPLGYANLTEDAKDLANKVRKIQDEHEMDQFVSCFNQFCVKFESCGEYDVQLQKGLLMLLNLLVDSTSESLAKDQWVKGQLNKLRETMAEPLDLSILAQAEHNLREIISRQKIISSSLGDAKSTLKLLMSGLIDNIDGLSETTGGYHDKIKDFSEQISEVDDADKLNHLLVGVLLETKQMMENVVDYQKDFLAARTEVDQAHNKINQLEFELQQMGEKVHEDHLTGIFNRRGLDEAYVRETARANRLNAPLCFALLDIDDFKRLNDTHGHKIGDDALVYLVDLVKQATRSEDIVARYGGEEFVVLLPNTSLDEAVIILSRIRRNLTKKYFLHENMRLLITFSAGLAEYQQGESQDEIFKRADEALYRAKKNGKNQILEAL